MQIKCCFETRIMIFLVCIHQLIENTLKIAKYFELALKEPNKTFGMYSSHPSYYFT